MFDTNGDGFLSIAEVKETMASLNMAVDQRTASEMMNLINADGNGTISKDQFVSIIMALPRS